MKFQIYSLVFVGIALTACNGGNSESTEPAVVLTEQSIDSIPRAGNRERPLPPTPYSEVMKTKPFTGKVASTEDVQKNGAIFAKFLIRPQVTDLTRVHFQAKKSPGENSLLIHLNSLLSRMLPSVLL